VTSGAPGVVVMATNYNANAAPYDTKQEMENSEFAVSVKPTNALIHGVECAKGETVLNQLYVRKGAPPAGQDLRLYDIGTFQFGSQQNPIQVLGELWVSYCVEFFKPILPDDVGGNILSSRYIRGTVDASNRFGTFTAANAGDLTLTFPNSNSFSFEAYPGNKYLVILAWNGIIASPVMPTMAVTGGSFTTPVGGYYPANSPASATNVLWYGVVLCNPESFSITIIGSGGGIIPTTLDITVTQYDATD
jgi:hypothetical protein